MKLFKDTNNNVYAYELDGSQDYLIPSDYISITDAEAYSMLNPPIEFTVAKHSLLVKIDANTDAVYSAVIGARGNEYNDASAQALAYRTAGYTGTAGNKVESWATAKGWTNTQAADNILAQTASWRAVEDMIRANRLSLKEAAKSSVDVAGLATVESNWNSFVVTIKGKLGLV